MSPDRRLDATELSERDVRRLAASYAAPLVADFGSLEHAVRLYRRHPERVLRSSTTAVPPVAILGAGADPDIAFPPQYDPRDPEQLEMVHTWRRERDAWIAEHAPELHRYQRTRS
jgi:hypothetical protein